jgi:hypothetical protein
METLCELHVNIHVAIMRDLLSSIGGAKVTSGENGEVGRSNHKHARRSRIPVTNHHLAETLQHIDLNQDSNDYQPFEQSLILSWSV